jgi:hypothetical protein
MLAMPSRAVAAAVMLCALSVMPAAAADYDWQVVSGLSTDYLERQVQRMAANGYRVQAIVADTLNPTIIVAREGGGLFRRNVPAVAEYRLLDPNDAAGIPALGAEGFKLRALGKARNGPALAIFERLLAGKTSPRDYRALMAPPAAPLDPLLASAAADGYRAIASAGDAGSELVIVEREANSGGAREVRVITAPDTEKLEEQINQLATEGFGCDTVWNRPPKGVALFKGGTLMAALSRRRGSTSPAAHVKIDRGERPSESGQLLAVVPYRNKFAFVIKHASSSDYSVSEVRFPDKYDRRSSSWIGDPFLERLRSQWWNPIELAWEVSSGNDVTSWVGVERRESPSRFTSSSTVTRREADKIAVPAGATALPRGGGEPGDAYRAHLDAIRSGDLPAAKALWTGRQRASWDENAKRFKAPMGLGFSEKDLFKTAKERMATDQTVLGGWINGDRATIRIEGTYDGTRAVADIDLTREAGVWKISEQHRWQAVGD